MKLFLLWISCTDLEIFSRRGPRDDNVCPRAAVGCEVGVGVEVSSMHIFGIEYYPT